MQLEQNFIQDILKAKVPLQLKILLCIIEEIAIPESKLCEKLHESVKKIRDSVEKLRDENLINILRCKETKEVIYSLKREYFDIEDYCKDCEFVSKKIVMTDIQTLKCDREGFPCKHKYKLSGYNILKHIISICENTRFIELEKKEVKKEYRHVDEWVCKDFVDCLRETWEEQYSQSIVAYPDYNFVRDNIQVMMNIFKEAFRINWRRMLKQYIFHIIDIHKTKQKYPTMYSINDKNEITKFINSMGKKNNKIEWCSEKSVYCSFVENCGCRLPEGQKSCTETIVSKMRKKYS